jgi:hypothetical protein
LQPLAQRENQARITTNAHVLRALQGLASREEHSRLLTAADFKAGIPAELRAELQDAWRAGIRFAVLSARSGVALTTNSGKTALEKFVQERAPDNYCAIYRRTPFGWRPIRMVSSLGVG